MFAVFGFFHYFVVILIYICVFVCFLCLPFIICTIYTPLEYGWCRAVLLHFACCFFRFLLVLVGCPSSGIRSYNLPLFRHFFSHNCLQNISIVSLFFIWCNFQSSSFALQSIGLVDFSIVYTNKICPSYCFLLDYYRSFCYRFPLYWAC